MTFQLTSPAFQQGDTIPKQFTGDGADLSPPLNWTRPPKATQSLVLICDDPDAPRRTYVHWVVYNIPAETDGLSEVVTGHQNLPPGALQGTNDFGQLDYGGPAPPPGKPHRYFFQLYAVDCLLKLPEGASKQQVLNALEGHLLDQCQLMGTYGR